MRLNIVVDPDTKAILVVRTKTDVYPLQGRFERITAACEVTKQALNVIAHYMDIAGLSEAYTDSGVLRLEKKWQDALGDLQARLDDQTILTQVAVDALENANAENEALRQKLNSLPVLRHGS